MEIKIQDLIPNESTFYLKQTDLFYDLMPCTAGKLCEMERKFGDISKIISIPIAENVCKLAMSLMKYDHALRFKKQTVKYVDVETGDEAEKEVGGYRLLMDLIAGIDEQYAIYGAVLKSMGQDQKEVDRLLEEIKTGINKATNDKVDDDLKKKLS